MVEAVAPLELQIRVGLQTGEVELVGGDVRGVSVHEAARIMALAGPGEVLVSEVTRQLGSGAEVRFVDRGEFQLRGVTGSRRLFQVTPIGSQ